MEKEEKKLLLKDLCARLPYGVKCEAIDKNARLFIAGKYEYIGEVVKNIGTLNSKESTIDGDLFGLRNIQHSTQNKYYVSPVLWRIENIKPYLRPMSNMSEEELKEFVQFTSLSMHRFECEVTHTTHWYCTYEEIDWLNKHHFDYRGLIPKGLALEAKEGMYD